MTGYQGRVRKTVRLTSLVAAFVLVGTMLVSSAGAAPPVSPVIKLIGPGEQVTLQHYRGEPTYLDTGVMVASLDAALEIRLTRAGYSQPVQVDQILDDGGPGLVVPLPDELFSSWNGFQDFFQIVITDESAVQVGEPLLMPFCPNSYWQERVSDDGPVLPTYPEGCYANPFTKGMVWGIDKNWAASTFSYEMPGVYLANGDYTVTVSVTDTYADALGMTAENRTFKVSATVKKADYGCAHGCEGIAPRTSVEAKSSAAPGGAVPIDDTPDPGILPDLRSLPAWGISVENRPRGRSFLDFGATVWVAGAGSLVVEGYRRPNEPVMDAYQYFYENGEPISKSAVGELEFDDRAGHNHWHFLQFAEYSLVDVAMTEPGIRSKKEAFCLAPTDGIDLSLDGAVMRPGSIGIGTACGSPNSAWVREILPLGWGDTYFQGLPGQSFNITDLPNGTYFIKVEANPLGSLHEQGMNNNIQYRKVVLKGQPGRRSVRVPKWHGIDSEGGYPYY